MEISSRQTQLLKHIVEEYVYDAQPVSSNQIIDKYMKGLSSATIRNDMAALEKLGLLEKAHTSSGRIPSIAGYKYYKENILKSSISTEIKTKLSNIFATRNLSIDVIINEAVEIIKDSFSLPVVITSTNDSETLKRFDLVPLDNAALVMIVTSSGNVIQNKITNVSPKQMSDISTCVRVFNDRLIDTPMNMVSDKIDSLKDLIRNVVKEYEFCIQQIIGKLFDKKLANTKTNVSGRELLPNQPEFRDIEKMGKMLSFLEDTNVWNHISYIQSETGKTAITFGNDIGLNKNLVIASTSIGNKNLKKQLSIVGPSRIDYSKVKGVLDFIQEEINKIDR